MNVDRTSSDQLDDLRQKIDEIDQQLFSLVAQRMAVVRDIGTLKRRQGIRESRLKARLKDMAADVLEPWHVEELASAIIKISRDLQSATEGA
jgi:chorismate mutase